MVLHPNDVIVVTRSAGIVTADIRQQKVESATAFDGFPPIEGHFDYGHMTPEVNELAKAILTACVSKDVAKKLHGLYKLHWLLPRDEDQFEVRVGDVRDWVDYTTAVLPL